MNELLLIITLLVSFGGTILFLKIFGKGGLFAWIGIATVFANIEVTIVVHAFGMDQTLGNTLFAATFLATDILSEIYGKKEATKGVLAGLFTSLTFILLSFMWVHYIPAQSDWASGFVKGLFTNTPRMLLSSLIAYAISEWIDVQLYHAWWNLTEKKTGDHSKMLWFRNNFSTLISQFVNIVIFNFGAFWGIYSFAELLAITGAFLGAMLVVKPSFDFSATLPTLAGFIGGVGAGLAYACVRKLSSLKCNGKVIVLFFSGYFPELANLCLESDDTE